VNLPHSKPIRQSFVARAPCAAAVHTCAHLEHFVFPHMCVDDNRFLLPSAVEHLRREFDRVYSLLHPRVHDEWVLSAHQHVGLGELEWLWELATAPALLDALESVFGTSDIVLFSTQLATKRPGQGTEVPWHQDGERCQTVWIPIDDVCVSSFQK
jgi:hypothetical protein